MPTIKLTDEDAIMEEMAEVLDVDPKYLYVRSHAKIQSSDKKAAFYQGDVSLVRELQVKSEKIKIWIFTTEEDAQLANYNYILWLAENDELGIDLSSYVNDHLLKKFVHAIVKDGNQAQELATESVDKFWALANNVGIFDRNIEQTYVPDKVVTALQNKLAEIAAQSPMEYLEREVGKKQAKRLVLDGVGVDATAVADQMVEEQMIKSKSGLALEPLSIDGIMHETRYGLLFIQVAGKPMEILELQDLPSPI